MLDPARLRERLTEFLLRQAAHAAGVIEDDGARAGGALVEGENVFHGAWKVLQQSYTFFRAQATPQRPRSLRHKLIA
jgi:hypothetical protein